MRIEAFKDDIERLKAALNPPVPRRSPVPLHMTEDEEDITFQRDTGLLQRQAAEQLLSALQFENTDVDIYDSEDLSTL